MSLSAAFKWFFKVLREGEPVIAPPPAPAMPVFTPSAEPAIQVLALLQKEGRLVDFLMEDIASFADADIGAAARDVHRGCSKVLRERVRLERIRSEAEGSTVSVPEGFDASQVQLLGNLVGAAPYTGELRHRGWRAASIDLPTVPSGADLHVVAPAEVEIA